MIGDSTRNRARLLAPISKAFSERLFEKGATPNGVYWSSAHGQSLRFDILLGIIPADEQALGGVTINDLGCGYGALFDRLEDHPMMIDGRYYGYDISPAMIREANARHADRRAEFIVAGAATRAADYSLVSGTYNMKMGHRRAEWQDYIFASLRELWGKTRKGLAFNMLDGSGADKPGGLYYAPAGEYFDFCTAALSRNVEVTPSGILKEWTIYVRR